MTETTAETVHIQSGERVAWITLDRPPLNILDIPTIQQLAAAIFDCPRIEFTRRATSLAWASPNPLQISAGRMNISNAPGLGVELDDDWLDTHRYAGETGWA